MELLCHLPWQSVIDGIGGEAKCLVRQHVVSKCKNISVQCAADFAGVWKRAIPHVSIHLMTKEHLNSFENIWDQAEEVKGISKAHRAILNHGELSTYAHANAKEHSNTIAFED